MTFEPDWVAPPGDTIVRLMSVREIEKEELAEELGLDDEEFESLVAGQVRISYSLAKTLSNCLGSTPRFWLQRDQIYTAELKRLNSDNRGGLDEWANSMPTRQMGQFGWIQKNLRSKKLQDHLLDFFGCESLAEWKASYVSGLDAVSFRTSSAFEADDFSTLVWKRVGEIQAKEIHLSAFDSEAFEEQLPQLKRLAAYRSPRKIMERLRDRLARVGVAVTSARTPSRCRASGATWKLESGNPIIHLSFRHLSDDHFWFTLYHEAAHIALRHGEHVDYDHGDGKGQIVDREEQEANVLASQLLVPAEVRNWLLSRRLNPNNVMAAARKARVASGVIVGQLEKEGAIQYGAMSYLKRRYRWGDNAIIPDLK